MTFTDAAKLAGALIVSLGGAGAIILGLSNWIGGLLANRYVERVKGEIAKELEDFKTRLKKSEFVFQKQYEAASSFVALKSDILPTHRFPEMEWTDACENIAEKFDKVERQLRTFVSVHGAVLSSEALKRIESAEARAGEGKFEVHGDEVSREGTELADEMWDDLKAVEELLLKEVRTQAAQ
jgi:hypothetical protein